MQITMDPLLGAAKSAEDWGWKNKLQDNIPACPLYYGCPDSAEYFCCERHRHLWHEERPHSYLNL